MEEETEKNNTTKNLQHQLDSRWNKDFRSGILVAKCRRKTNMNLMLKTGGNHWKVMTLEWGVRRWWWHPQIMAEAFNVVDSGGGNSSNKAIVRGARCIDWTGKVLVYTCYLVHFLSIPVWLVNDIVPLALFYIWRGRDRFWRDCCETNKKSKMLGTVKNDVSGDLLSQGDMSETISEWCVAPCDSKMSRDNSYLLNKNVEK